MAVRNVARDMKSRGEAGKHNPHDKETGEVYFVEVFGIKKEVGDAKVFAKISGDHRKEDYPAKHQYVIAPDVVHQQLDRKGVNDLGNQEVKLTHK